MNLLQSIYEKTQIKYSKDMTDAVPPDLMKEIQKNIRDGASNTKLQWANALELAHKAYKVANVQKPYPSMKNAWKQYEENIQFAVQQLALTRGMDADWRMSSSMFMEAENQKQFTVTVFNGTQKQSYQVESDDVEKVTDKLVTETFSAYDVEQKVQNGKIRLSPRKFGIKQPFSVVISES